MSSVTKFAAISLLALTVAACGVRGSLKAPPQAAADTSAAGAATEGAKKGHKPFILDGLIE